MAINLGVNASKAVSYVLVGITEGVNVSKAVAYALLAPPDVDPPSWPSFTFGNGVVGIAYAQSFTPNGTTPVTVTVTSGALPGGLALSLVSGSTYEISGTPTTAGTFPFTLTATNAYGSAAQAFSILISPAPGAGGEFAYCFVA